MNSKSWNFSPVAYLRSDSCHRFEAPRQAVYSGKGAFVEILPQYAAAASDLDGFDRIWLIFCFHLNADRGWKPLVRPPVSPDGGCYGLFATRSPYRPNPIGISCVELLEVRRNVLVIGPCDLLDGTPVLDIKPYIPEADAFPGAAAGWRDAANPSCWEVGFTPRFEECAAKLLELGGPDTVNFCLVQLGTNPFDKQRKRLGFDGGLHSIGCRTWKIRFSADEAKRKLLARELVSNYPEDELLPGAPDPYGDKELHRRYLAWLGAGR